ncbi:hypothetical protein [Streptomyces tunisiensis]|uniref:hypothetical protein n=1 Tax=Streptomyces tunisiensis TaxID=948699 RepID=UPI003EE414FA
MLLTDNLVPAPGLVALASFLWGPFYTLGRAQSPRGVPDEVRRQTTGARTAVTSPGFPLGCAARGALLSVSTSTAVAVLALAYLVLAVERA